MAEMWYYTNEGKQMDPVSIKELKKMVGQGLLKPTDMIWKEGMARWIRASSLKELFPDPISALDKYFTHTAQAAAKEAAATGAPTVTGAAASPSNGSPAAPASTEKKKKPTASDDGEEEDTRRPPRRREDSRNAGGSNVGIIIALIVCGGLLIVAMCGGVGILAWTFSDSDAPPKKDGGQVGADGGGKKVGDGGGNVNPKNDDGKAKEPPLPPGVRNGSDLFEPKSSMKPNSTLIVKFQPQAGYRATITVIMKTKADPGVSLTVVKEKDNAQVAATNRPDTSATVNFTLQATEVVLLRIRNESKAVTGYRVIYDVSPK